MQKNLTWKKELFSNSYRIYSNGKQIGYLKDKSFSKSGIGVLNNKEFLYQTKGFFKQKAEIIDIAEDKMVGEINYNNWKTKATIIVNAKTISWKYDNLLNTRWSVFDSDGVKVRYSDSLSGGQIESNIDDALLLLSGLFVSHYYRQKSFAVIVAIFIPIWITMQ